MIIPIVLPQNLERPPQVLAAVAVLGNKGVYDAPRPAASRVPIPVLPLTGTDVLGEAFAGMATLLSGIVLLSHPRRAGPRRTRRGGALELACSNLPAFRPLDG